MVALGVWQLQRADEKIELQRAADDALASAPLTLAQYLSDDVSANPVRITFTGEPLWDQQFLWDNRVHRGSAGFEAVMPFRVGDGLPLVLVNRGWLPPGTDRANLPDVSSSESLPAVDGTRVQVTGVITRPSKGFASGEAFTLEEWPRVMQFFDYEAMEMALGEPVVAGLVEPGAQAKRTATALWYTDNWQPVASGPERHYGYAFQWFAMFIALTVLYFSLNLRRLTDNSAL